MAPIERYLEGCHLHIKLPVLVITRIGKAYLDHGGSQLPAKTLVNSFAIDLNHNLYGNPHSASTPSHLAGQRIDEIRDRTLRFFNADPKNFDLIFVANATAAVHLVGSCFREYASRLPRNGAVSKKKTSFSYVYHQDCHNSLIGIRELANNHRCFSSDSKVEAWLTSSSSRRKDCPRPHDIGLFAYPGQSNFNGRRLPLSWPRRIRESSRGTNTYTLLDAAALATTTPLNLDDIQPDFCCLSMYKIFGFPDLGALIVRKSSGGPILMSRIYFAGGTVDLVNSTNDTTTSSHKRGRRDRGSWHIKRSPQTGSPLHESLEEGTLPFHSIIALSHALTTHITLFGPDPMHSISRRTSHLAAYTYTAMRSFHHGNGAPLFKIYASPTSTYGDPRTQGATIAFNVLRPDGSLVGYKDVERAADQHDIYVRSGGHCNPGGVSAALGWSGEEKWRVWEESGHSCGNPVQTFRGRATGVVRLSLGACSVRADVDKFLDFVWEEYRDGMEVVGGIRAGAWDVLDPVESRTDSMDLTEVADGEIEVADSKRMEKGQVSRWHRSVMELTKVKKAWRTAKLGMQDAGI